MACFLVPEAKKTQRVDFSRPLESYIGNTYDNIQPSDFIGSVKELGTLREGTCERSPDKHEAGIDLIVRYYSQLEAIESKLPIAEDKIHIKFTWHDSFSGGGMFGKKASMVSAMFEKCCVLFNIGILQGQVAKVQNLDSDEGLKSAAKYFQGAAGTFQRLRELVFAHLQTPPTPDMSAECTTALQSLMLAQAQECFVLKVARDKMKPINVAKLAMQASDLYADAYSNMIVGSVKEMWDKSWLAIVSSKQAHLHGYAQHYMALQCKADKKFGSSIARMQKALELLKEADRKGSGYFQTKTFYGQVQRELETTQKDNNIIYNDLIPKFDTLEPIPKTTIAKPVPFQTPPPNFVDIFSSLMPTDVHQAMQTYNAKRDSLVSGELKKLQDASQLMNNTLAEWNLPACIEETGDDSVPESILEKNKSVREQGGLAALEQLIVQLPEQVERNKEIIAENQRILDEEERDDTGLRDNFKEKWKRTGSGDLNKAFRQEIAKYNGVLQQAGSADKTVKEKFDSCKKAIEILSKPEAELIQCIPKGGTSAVRAGSQSIAELKTLMEEVSTLKAEREVIVTTLKDPVTDITPKFLQSLKEEGAVDEASISEAHLSSTYTKLQEQANENLTKQNDLMRRVEEVYKRFHMETGGKVSPREQLLKQLAAGYDTFSELNNNLKEGNKFYGDLTPILMRQQSKINDFTFARKTEKEELMKDIQRSFSTQPTPAPQPPQASSQPPQRPPPPQAQAQQPPPAPGPAPVQAYHHPPGPTAPPPVQPVQAGGWGQGYAPQPQYYQPPPQGYPGYPPAQPQFNTYYPSAPQSGYYTMPPASGYPPQYHPPPRR